MPADFPSVEFENVGFSYGKREVLQGINLKIEAAQIFGLLGANGAGKTTLIRLIMGMIRPDSGNIRVFSEGMSSHHRDETGYMPQLNALYNELSVEENIDFFARMHGMSDKKSRNKAVDQVIELIALTDRRKDSIVSLSGGMKQRVSLAVALVHSPRLLVLDEPTVGLDPVLRATFWEYFRNLSKKGTTIVISSHTMDDANHCDRLVFLQDGVILADGSPEAIIASSGLSDSSLESAFLELVQGKNHES